MKLDQRIFLLQNPICHFPEHNDAVADDVHYQSVTSTLFSAAGVSLKPLSEHVAPGNAFQSLESKSAKNLLQLEVRYHEQRAG
jgi:hypothetical protein